MNKFESAMQKAELIAELKDRVSYCMAEDADLNDWETEFLGSIYNQLDDGRFLTERQLGALEKIEYKVENGLDEYREMYGD